MRKIYLSLLCLPLISFMNKLTSQEYLPLPETDAKWINTHSTLQWEPFPHYTIDGVVNYCSSNSDTLINGQTYFIIDTCDNGHYKGAMRNDNGKVWFVPKGSDSEYLLYDFTAAPGDTIFDVYIEWFGGGYFLEDLYVDPSGVDSVLIGGQYRKRISFMGIAWIEGIGNTQGLFLEPWPNISEYLVDLYCMSANDTTYYPDFTAGDCQFPVGKEELRVNQPEVMVYPNPADATLYFSLDNGLNRSGITFQLYDVNGSLLIDEELQNKENMLDISYLKGGLYFFVITSTEFSETCKIVIK